VETTDLPNANPRTRADFDLEINRDIMTTLTPLTGRDTEVGLLSDRWEQAQEGMGQVVLIVGEAGLGKSRLVHTLKQLVLAEKKNDSSNPAAVAPVIEWRCSPRHQNTELHPAAEYLARLLDFEHEESTGARFDRLARHLEDCGLDRRKSSRSLPGSSSFRRTNAIPRLASLPSVNGKRLSARCMNGCAHAPAGSQSCS
jgi:predicted ATPase